jgi:hypothetical protein
MNNTPATARELLIWVKEYKRKNPGMTEADRIIRACEAFIEEMEIQNGNPLPSLCPDNSVAGDRKTTVLDEDFDSRGVLKFKKGR